MESWCSSYVYKNIEDSESVFITYKMVEDEELVLKVVLQRLTYTNPVCHL